MLFLRLIVLGIAFCIDLFFGDPPSALHPTAWMGSLIGFFSKNSPENKGPAVQFIFGILIILVGGLCVGTLGLGLETLIQRLPVFIGLLFGGIILKITFTLRGLVNASNQVVKAFAEDDLEEARQLVAWHLVSRNTKSLDKSQVSAAAIESVAENTSDSIIAPIFYFFLFGLPGALVYRFVNTADAMLGYRSEKYEWLGKASARLDDLLNIIPARLTALLFVLAAPVSDGDIKKAVSVWWTDRKKTASPNAGHPMSAAAGALGIRLEKDGYYILGGEQKQPSPDDLCRMLRLMKVSIVIGSVLASILVIGMS